VSAVARLEAEGATVPFIARYRKEATRGLDEVQIRVVLSRLASERELSDRRSVVLRELEKQGVLDAALRARVTACESRSELEDVYLPYRPKRRTRATQAREQGLEPLADALLGQVGRPREWALRFVAPERGVPTVDAAIDGAKDIAAERLAEDAELRAELRGLLREQGTLRSRKARGKQKEVSRFDDYAQYEEPLRRVPGHRVHALERGEEAGVLKVEVALEGDRQLAVMERRVGLKRGSEWAPILRAMLEDAWERLLLPSLGNELRKELRENADRLAARVFAQNLSALLLAPPLGEYGVIAVDPGQRTGCKVAVLGPRGEVVTTGTWLLLHGERALLEARARLLEWCCAYRPRAIGIGDGTHGRETEQQLRAWLAEFSAAELPVAERPVVVSVSESGASIYSASDAAREELPELDVVYRGAVSIGRRLQDPLAELVKIEPQHLGVGQYQHDVPADWLARELATVVESAVNAVGVELNTASAALLSYVSGIGPSLAKRIVEARRSRGRFRRRAELLEVTGLGPKTFQQAAGFLRVRGGGEPLDSSAVHPERYGLVELIARDAGCKVSELIGNESRLTSISWERYRGEDVGDFTLADIRAELLRPGRDPRASFVAPAFREDVRRVEDVQEGMVLEGVVTNVTRFGAFVNIGVKQDGLVHVSELADRFVTDPSEVVRVGQRLTVRVLGVDRARQRISLSARSPRER
jgi:uncharacterized protein